MATSADSVVRAHIDTATKERAAAALEAMGLSISSGLAEEVLRAEHPSRGGTPMAPPSMSSDDLADLRYAKTLLERTDDPDFVQREYSKLPLKRLS